MYRRKRKPRRDPGYSWAEKTIFWEKEDYKISASIAKVHRLVAQHKRCRGHCSTIAGWDWVPAVGADQVCLKGQPLTVTLHCRECALITRCSDFEWSFKSYKTSSRCLGDNHWVPSTTRDIRKTAVRRDYASCASEHLYRRGELLCKSGQVLSTKRIRCVAVSF